MSSGSFDPQKFSIFGALLPEQINDAILITDAPESGTDHKILYANKAFEAISGYTCEELIGKSPKIFQGPGSDPDVLARARKAIQNEDFFNGTILNYKKTGEPYIIGWKLLPARDQSGKVTRWVAIQNDISKRIALEGTVGELEERMKTLLDALHEGIWYWDAQTDAMAWSSRLKKIFGFEEGHNFIPTGRSYFERITKSDVTRVRNAFDDHINKFIPFDVEHEIITESNEIRMVRATAQSVRDADGNVERMIGTIRDITRERRIKNELLRAEQIADFGTWVVDLSLETVRWSPHLYRIYGYEPYSVPLSVETGLNGYHPDDRPRVERIINKAIETQVFEPYEARLVLPDQQVRDVQVLGEVEVNANNEPIRLFGIIFNRTEQKRREEELIHARRVQAVGELVGGVAHDFNNLMAITLGNLEILEDFDLSDEARECVQSAIRATEQGASLTESLLSFTRDAPLKATEISPNKEMQDILKLLKRVLPENINLKFSPDDGDGRVVCDVKMLEACVMNLITNARDSLSSGGEIVVSVTTVPSFSLDEGSIDAPVLADEYTMIAVQDNGSGMSKEVLERATDPFYTTKSVGKGTGLGLSRVRGFAEQSGGFFHMESELGKGTTVSMFLPSVASTEDITTGDKPDSAVEPDQSKQIATRILLVEDQDALRDMLEKMLRKAGADIIAAESGDAAWALAKEHDFDVVVTDIVMPGKLQGSHLVEKLRQSGYEFGAVFISGYARTFDVSAQHLTERDSRLTKPVTRKSLIAAVRKAVPVVERDPV